METLFQSLCPISNFAMEVKGVVPKQLPDGTVQLTLSKTRDAIRCQTLENMWKNLESAGKQPCTPEDAAVPKASEEATQIPAEHAWRCKVRSAVRETMAEIAERAENAGESLEEMFPIHGKLAAMDHRLLTDPDLDKKDAHETLRLGRMFLYLCDLESDSEAADNDVAAYEVEGEIITVSTVEM